MFSVRSRAEKRAGTLVLALGNDILGDDGAALAAARLLLDESLAGVDVVESAEAGLALVELLTGYDRALLLDAVVTGRARPGTVMEISLDDLPRVVAPSPHYAGLPDVIELAGRLGVPLPGVIRILAIEVEDPHAVSEEFTTEVDKSIPTLARGAMQILEAWRIESRLALLLPPRAPIRTRSRMTTNTSPSDPPNGIL